MQRTMHIHPEVGEMAAKGQSSGGGGPGVLKWLLYGGKGGPAEDVKECKGNRQQ